MDKAVLIRTLVLAFALVNQSLVLAGYSTLPWAEDDLEAFLTGAFTAGAAAWAWYKNNSVTREARKADEYLRELKKKRGDK